MSNLGCDDKEKRLEGEKYRVLSSKAKFGRHGPLYLFVLIVLSGALIQRVLWRDRIL